MTKLTTEVVLKRCIDTHKKRYIYDKLNYVNRRTKVTVTCRIHGDFLTNPLQHTKGSGCPKCGYKTMSRVNGWVGVQGKRANRSSYLVFRRKLKKYKLKERFIEKLGTQYNYDKVSAVNNEDTDKVEIVCKTHGSFWQTPKIHFSGSNCPKCVRPYKDLQDVISICDKGHTYKRTYYDYHINKNRCPVCNGGMFRPVHEVQSRLYEGNLTLLTNGPFYKGTEIIQYSCPIHGVMEKPLTKVYTRNYCGKCRKQGFKVHEPGYLYYLSINNGQAYKIGVTNRSVHKRYTAKDRSNITVLREWYYENGQECLDKETEILNQFKTSKYTGEPLLNNGNTELFNVDILQLDIQI